jgi:major membrane immunogen (membrane-anchored lipoprotein)
LSRHTVTKKFLTNSLARFHNRNEHPGQYQHRYQRYDRLVWQEIWHEEFGGRGRVSSAVVYQNGEGRSSEKHLVSKHADSDTMDPDADRLIPNRMFRKFVHGAVQTELESSA